MTLTRRGWRMSGKGVLTSFEEPMAPPRPGWVHVAVAGCGVCHTDVGFLYDAVPTKHALPLVLGHEISGVVVSGGEGARQWEGKRVLVPSVTPCGHCSFCKRGKPTACRESLMPGNDHDGGFASHVEVPAHALCLVEGAAGTPIGAQGLELWELSVLADAITTPLQAMKRCGLAAGEVAIVIGTGGVGIHGIQIARALGAKVVAIDVDPRKLERASQFGAGLTLDARTAPKELKKQIGAYSRAQGGPSDGWRVFEMSGTKGGQELSFGLLTQGGSISVVGFTPETVNVRLSSLMAYDATVWGNWGCDPALYPDALALVTSGAVKVRGLVRKEPMSETPRVLEAVHRGELSERVVLVP